MPHPPRYPRYAFVISAPGKPGSRIITDGQPLSLPRQLSPRWRARQRREAPIAHLLEHIVRLERELLGS